MKQFKKYNLKKFTIPEGKYIINSDKSITVQDLVVEMKSVPQKRRKPRESKPPRWFKDFVDNEFRPFREEFDTVVKINKLKTK